MGPAGQRFEAGDVARLQVDQRLIEQVQLVLVERPAKLGLDREAAPRRARLLGLVDLRPARLLGLLHRELGVAEQFLGVLLGGISATPIAQSTLISRSQIWNGADIAS